MTPEEFKNKARAKLRAKRIKELAWSDITTAVGAAPQAFKDSVVEALRKENPGQVGRLLSNLMLDKVKVETEAELDSIVADNQLSLDEFDRIFGD